MEPFYSFISVVSLLIFSGAAVAVDHAQGQDIQNQMMSSSSENGFQKVIQSNANDIYNAVNNALAGREEPETVKKMILTEYRGTQRDSTYSQEEIKINDEYQALLNEAYSAVQVYEAGGTPDLSKLNSTRAALY
jgi:hypothetical protein